MNGFIYKVTNRVNNKVYIGQTRFTVEHRWKQHIKNFNIEHRQQALYKAFSKYGLENFYVETIEEVDCEKLNEREMYWIAYYDSFKNGYNATLGGDGKIYSFTDSQYDEIKNLYLSGFSSAKIADLFNVSAYTILGILKTMNVKIRRNPLKMNAYELNELIGDYKNGYSLQSIAKRYNTDRETVKRFLVSKGVDIRDKSQILKNTSLHKELISDFLDGMTYKNLEKKYHADTRTLKRILVINGINLKSYRKLRQTTKGAFCLTDEQCLNVIKDYNDKMKLRDIARKYEINISTLYKLLDRYHVKYNRYNRSKSLQSLKDENLGIKCTPDKLADSNASELDKELTH